MKNYVKQIFKQFVFENRFWTVMVETKAQGLCETNCLYNINIAIAVTTPEDNKMFNQKGELIRDGKVVTTRQKIGLQVCKKKLKGKKRNGSSNCMSFTRAVFVGKPYHKELQAILDYIVMDIKQNRKKYVVWSEPEEYCEPQNIIYNE